MPTNTEWSELVGRRAERLEQRVAELELQLAMQQRINRNAMEQLAELRGAAYEVVHKEMQDIEMGDSIDNLAAILGDENGRD